MKNNGKLGRRIMVYLKPEKATGKWCPMARIYNGNRPSYNRSGDGSRLFESRCLAEECMMWRRAENTVDNVGYCGLAGIAVTD